MKTLFDQYPTEFWLAMALLFLIVCCTAKILEIILTSDVVKVNGVYFDANDVHIQGRAKRYVSND